MMAPSTDRATLLRLVRKGLLGGTKQEAAHTGVRPRSPDGF